MLTKVTSRTCTTTTRSSGRSGWTAIISRQLYDYEVDPHETVNVAGEAANAALVKEMHAQLQELVAV